MKTECPHCDESVDIGEEEHYKLVRCPKCEHEFQAFSESTQKLTREFLDEVLKRDDADG